jgi:prepilin-type processing-associated H-X9-DG protein
MRGFRCPVDSTDTGHPGYGPGNYASNHLLLRRRLKLDTLAEQGTANVLLFAEKYATCSYWALTEGEQTPWYLAGADSGFQVRPAACDPALPQTPHRSGIQVGMADGSVRTVAPQTNPEVWFRLHGTCPPADGDR